RLRETINRGGEKISPYEIEDVLKQHGAVSEAVTFAIPHATLGHDVAAAVVLREECTVTEAEIPRFVTDRILHFKVPRQVSIVKSIRRTSTGKIQRVGLAERLGLIENHGNGSKTSKDSTAPGNELEAELAAIWSFVFGAKVGIHDDFFELGGDSIHAARIIS